MIVRKHSQGSITWAPLVAQDYWRVKLDGLRVGGQGLNSDAATVILDTGTSLLAGPADDINNILQLLNVNAVADQDGDYTVNCRALSTMPSLIFTIGGTDFELTPEDYVMEVVSGRRSMCILGFSAVDIPPPNGPIVSASTRRN